MTALTALLWDEDKGAWFDYDLENQKKNHEFYPSNLAPLWAGCFSDPATADKALQYLEVRGQQRGRAHREQHCPLLALGSRDLVGGSHCLLSAPGP